LSAQNKSMNLSECRKRLERIPAADVRPVGLLEQVEWERDTALAQLAEIGKSLGEKMDDVRPVPDDGIGEMSDGYHTFNGLYYQRMVLFAALVKAYKDKAWQSLRHEDGELCFDGGWFIVGIDTPEGSYTYHYEDKDWNRFDCVELPVAKHWDGHTEEDVTRLLSLDARPVVTCADCEHNNHCLTQSFVDDCGKIPLDRNTFFCADGERRSNA